MNAKTVLSKGRDFFGNHPIIAALIWICIAAFILIWLVMLFLKVWTHHGEDSIVPEIKHLTYSEAQARLKEANLEIEISDSIYDTSVAPGTIVESWPKAGSEVKRGRKVYVTLTAFNAKHVTLSMPITGVSARQAISYLNALGINTIRIVNVPSQYPDLVEGAHYDGRPLGVGSVVPVDANIVLEVGHYVEPEDSVEESYGEDDGLDGNGEYHTEPIETSSYSSYIDDEL